MDISLSESYSANHKLKFMSHIGRIFKNHQVKAKQNPLVNKSRFYQKEITKSNYDNNTKNLLLLRLGSYRNSYKYVIPSIPVYILIFW